MPLTKKVSEITINLEKNNYELALILRAQTSNEAFLELVKNIQTTISQMDIQILKQDIQDNKLFAYPIKKETSGSYVFFNVKADPKMIAVFKNKLSQNNHILRFLVIKQIIKKQKTKPRTIKSIRQKPQDLQKEKGPKKEIKTYKEPKISIQELDKKLDKILEGEI